MYCANCGEKLQATWKNCPNCGTETKPTKRENSPTSISIKRPSQFVNKWRKYHLFSDDKKIGEVGDGEEKVFVVPSGKHSFYIKLDWIKSEILTLDIQPGETVHLVCGADVAKNTAVAFLGPILSAIPQVGRTLLYLKEE